MDRIRRLVEAAQTGNVDRLLTLIKDDPLLLHYVALEEEGDHTPLHIASMAGHLNFVQEILKLRKEFAWELNQDGFSPLHIASANGYVEIVKELLKVNHTLCLLRGRENRIPLHWAVMKGRIHVIKELLDSSPLSVQEVTARGDTALHLAVKNNQFEALTILVEHLNEVQRVDVLNNKDNQGNTIVHLAASRKQYEVVELLLGEHLIASAAVEVNSLNNSGLTALDVFLSRDREIEEILLRAGAVRAVDLHTQSQAASSSQNQGAAFITSNDQPVSDQEQTQPPALRLLKYLCYKEDRDSPSEVRNVLLVIAALIATSTYQAVLSPPSGVWQDVSNSSRNINSSTVVTTISKSHDAGNAIMASNDSFFFVLFLVFNSMGFCLSLNMIGVLTNGFPLQLELRLAFFSLVVTYNTAMYWIIRTSSYAINIMLFVFSFITPIAIPFATKAARNHLKWLRNLSPRFTNVQRTAVVQSVAACFS